MSSFEEITLSAHDQFGKALASGEYSDFEVHCNGRVFKVHKVIVCPQSIFFANAVKKNAFKPDVVDAMIRFLYTLDYPTPADIQRDKRLSMFFHLDVYALADMIQNEPLRATAESHFKAVFNTGWDEPVFGEIVRRVFKWSPPGEKGARMRRIVVDMAAYNADTLFGKDKELEMLIDEVEGFGKDFAKALCKPGKYKSAGSYNKLEDEDRGWYPSRA